MIGQSYKKFAQKQGLFPYAGVAYGEIGGFLTTLSEGLGNKDLFVSLSFPGEETRLSVLGELSRLDAQFQILRFEVTDRFLFVSFRDTLGTIKRIEGFMAWLYPFLAGVGAQGVTHCPECKEPIAPEERVYKLINQNAYALHAHCAEKVRQDLAAGSQAQAEEPANYGRGTLGAFIGGMVGAIPWAIVYAIGFFVGWLGYLIGFLALKGYTWFGGKVKKPTLFIIMGVIVFSVLFAQILGDGLSLGALILGGELPGFELTDIPLIFVVILKEDPEYLIGFALNVVLGLAFAIWGAFGLFRKVSQEAKAQNLVMADLPAPPKREAVSAGVR